MVDAKEIKIDNWFEHNGNWSYRGDSKKPFKFQWNEADWYALGECTLFLEDVFPIPLTSEILIACGFKYFKDYDDVEKKEVNTYYIKIGKIQISFIYRMLVINANNEHSREAQIILSHEVKYLHQLQNLIYSLTNSELKINL